MDGPATRPCGTGEPRSARRRDDHHRPHDRLGHQVRGRTPDREGAERPVVTETGWFRAHGCSHPGMLSTTTKAAEANTSGARTGNAAAWAVSGLSRRGRPWRRSTTSPTRTAPPAGCRGSGTTSWRGSCASAGVALVGPRAARVAPERAERAAAAGTAVPDGDEPADRAPPAITGTGGTERHPRGGRVRRIPRTGPVAQPG